LLAFCPDSVFFSTFLNRRKSKGCAKVGQGEAHGPNRASKGEKVEKSSEKLRKSG